MLLAACGGPDRYRTWPAVDVYADGYLLEVIAQGGPVYAVRQAGPGPIVDRPSYRRAQLRAVAAVSGCRVVEGTPVRDALAARVSCPRP